MLYSTYVIVLCVDPGHDINGHREHNNYPWFNISVHRCIWLPIVYDIFRNIYAGIYMVHSGEVKWKSMASEITGQSSSAVC